MRNFIVVIPARLDSKRLPKKPLIIIEGLPMIIRTANQCSKVIDRKNIIIATDSKKIKAVCNNFSYKCVLTSKKCLTGTDRVAEVAKKIKAKTYINLQGDEPIFNPKDIKKFLKISLKNRNKILNGFSEIKNNLDYKNLSIPKLVFNNLGELMYISRSPIPGNKKNRLVRGWKQVCIYSFPREILLKFSKTNNKSSLEKIEDIEILRFLEMGFKVKMIKLSSNSFAIDTKLDLLKLKKRLKKR